MFENFDFSVLDSGEYKEDAVREDLLSPLLKAIGYQPTGERRMQRSQTLAHPFTMIGSKKHKVNITPDYTLWFKDEVVLIVDAKHPGESLVKSSHAEQAYSYAMHPQIRAKSYALCNGKEFVLYDVEAFEPVFQFELKDTLSRWTEILKHLSPEALKDRNHRQFRPDMGMFLGKLGMNNWTIPESRIQLISSLPRPGQVTCSADHDMIEGQPFAGSFDILDDGTALNVLTSVLPSQVRHVVMNVLSSPGKGVYIGGVLSVSWTFDLGEPTTGLYAHEVFVPLIVKGIHRVDLVEPLGPRPPDMVAGVLDVPLLLESFK